MIKNIIFDYGDVFINLDKPATERAFREKGIEKLPDRLKSSSQKYEMGLLETDKLIYRFTDYYSNQFSKQEFIDAWNAILKDFPLHRLEFIKDLHDLGEFRLFLLSNTNELHISWIQEDWGMKLYNEFKSCFEQFYLSHEMGMRKPNSDIYEFVLNENGLKADETLFIDDTKENTDAAKKLGIHVWNIDPKTEDVVDLLARKEFNS